MIGRAVREKASEFDYRGSNELARFSRCVWRQKVLQIGQLSVPLAPWVMHEEVAATRGPMFPGHARHGWDDDHERKYQRRLASAR